MPWYSRLWSIMSTKKQIDPQTVSTQTRLARVLTTWDLAALGVGSTLGVGVYVLPGHVAKDIAGPSVILSFVLAGIVSAFAGLCYAEFGARAPKAGSAYIYSFVTVGQFIAYIIGWNLILEYVIGAASVARGLSLYLDKALNDTLKDWYKAEMPLPESNYFSEYFDLLAFGIPVLISIALAFGLKESTRVNNVCTILNLLVVLFVIIAGGIKADFKNWSLPVGNDTSIIYGSGGFFPFGFDGVLKGAATCFYGFVGFDCIATTGEEVKNPIKAIPRSIFWSLLVILISYVGTSAVVTLMVPYYLQDENAPIPHAFQEIDWIVPMWIVSIGGMFGLAASLFGAMFPLPRILYAMASDGLVFRFLGRVSSKFSTPLIGTILSGLLTGLMASLFELKQLVNMMSIGTLLAYTIVAACVLVLRYSGPEEYSLVRTSSDNDLYSNVDSHIQRLVNAEDDENEEMLSNLEENVTFTNVMKQIFNLKRHKVPTNISEKLVIIEILLFCVLSLALSLMYIHMIDPLKSGEVWAIVLISCTGFLTILTLISMALQPSVLRSDIFQVPWVPLFPALSILVNIYLMLNLDTATWVRFGIWMIIGLLIYFFCIKLYHMPPQKPKCNDVHDGKLYATENSKNNGHITRSTPEKDIKYTVEEETREKERISIDNIQQKGHTESKKGKSSRELDNTSVNRILADLDDTLSREESRKMFLDTISNKSNASNAFVEESVVAIVHREDVVSVPASPLSEHPSPIPESVQDLPELKSTNDEIDDNKETRSENSFHEDSPIDLEDNADSTQSDFPELNGTNDEIDDNKETRSENSFHEDSPIDLEDNADSMQSPVFELVLDDAKMDTITNSFVVENVIPPPPPMNDFEAYSPSSPKIFYTPKRKESINNSPQPPKKDNDSPPVETEYCIPPPPPMSVFETYSPKLTKKIDGTNASKDYGMKKSPVLRQENRIIVVERRNSSDNSSNESDDWDDNVRPGSKRHMKITSKLNKIFSQSSPSPRLTKALPPKVEEFGHQPTSYVPILEEIQAKHRAKNLNKSDTVNEKENNGQLVERNLNKTVDKVNKKLEDTAESDTNIDNMKGTKETEIKDNDNNNNNNNDSSGENSVLDDDTPLKPSDMKRKLEEIFRTKPRPKHVYPALPFNVKEKDVAKQLEEQNTRRDSDINKVNHRMKLANSLKSIRLRKVSSLRVDQEKPVENDTSAAESNSNDNSRKVDRTNSNANRNKHKGLMANSLASIRLRKVDSFDSKGDFL